MGPSASSWRWLGGRGATGRVDEEREHEPSEEVRSLGTPPGNRPVIGGADPEGLDAALPLAPPALGLSVEVRGAPCWRYWYKRKYGCSEGGGLLSAGLWGWGGLGAAVSEWRLRWWLLEWFWWSCGALRSLISVTLRSLAPRQMSDRSAPRSVRDAGRLLDWPRVGGAGGPPGGGGGIGIVLL